MRFLLDTVTVSELRNLRRCDPGVREWAGAVEPTDFVLSVVNLQEIESGILSIARKDQAQALVFRAWFEHIIMPTLGARALPVDEAVALRCAPLHVPNKRPYADSLIAATALVHDLTVVTRNVGDFDYKGVRVLNPWSA